MADLLFGILSRHLALIFEKPENVEISRIGSLTMLYPFKRPQRVEAFPERWSFKTLPGDLEWSWSAILEVYLFGNKTTAKTKKTKKDEKDEKDAWKTKKRLELGGGITFPQELEVEAHATPGYGVEVNR